MKRTGLVLLSLCLAATLFAGGAKEDAPAAAAVEYTGREAPMLAARVAAGELPPLEQRLPSEPDVAEPIESIGRYGGTLRQFIHGSDQQLIGWEVNYHGLVYWDHEKGELVPDIVRDYAVDSEAREFTFYLRRGMKWSDGAPYTVDDWIWWRDNVLTHDKIRPSVAIHWTAGGEVARFEKIDDHTVKVIFSSPRPDFLLRMAQFGHDGSGPQPAHYFQQIHGDFRDEAELNALIGEKGYVDWAAHYLDHIAPGNNKDRPVVAPWIATISLDDGQGRVVMERNPYYWRVDTAGNQLPYMDYAVYTSVETLDVASLRALQGDVDVQDRYLMETLEQRPLFADAADRGAFKIYDVEMGRAQSYSFNWHHRDTVLRDIMRDRRFRIALSHAMDRQQIIDLMFFGQGEPWQYSPERGSPYTHLGHAKAYTEYDPARANELLDEMGLTERSPAGFRLRPDGQELRILIDVRADRSAAIEEATLVANDWEAVGVRARVNTLDRTFWQTRINNVEFDVNQQESAPGVPTLLVRPRYFVPIEANSNQAVLYGRWYATGGAEGVEPTGVHRELIDLYDELKSTPDQDEWIRIVREIMDINEEHMFVLGTTMLPPQGGIAKPNIGNVPDRRMFPQDFGTHRYNWDPVTFYYKD